MPGAKPNRIKKLYLDDTYYLCSYSFQFVLLFLFYYVVQMSKINRKNLKFDVIVCLNLCPPKRDEGHFRRPLKKSSDFGVKKANHCMTTSGRYWLVTRDMSRTRVCNLVY